MLAAGIAQIYLVGIPNVAATISIINWVLGHSKFQLPLGLILPAKCQLTASTILFVPYLMPIVQRRLTSCKVGDCALPAVLSLTSLTHLHLIGTVKSAQVAWELPLLKTLQLVDFHEVGGDARVLAIGAMPQLQVLRAAHCTLDIHDVGALSRFTSLQQLALPSCGLQNLPSLAGMKQLKHLDISNNEAFDDIQSTLAGVRALAVLTANNTLRLTRALVNSVAAVTSLTRLELGWQIRSCTREEVHCLSGLCEIMFDCHGDCLMVCDESLFISLL